LARSEKYFEACQSRLKYKTRDETDKERIAEMLQLGSCLIWKSSVWQILAP